MPRSSVLNLNSGPAVTLLCMCKLGEKNWKRLPVVMASNGRIRSHYAMHDGEEKHYPDSYYVLRTYENRKTVYRTIGRDASEALAEQKRVARRLKVKEGAKAEGIALVIPNDESRVSLLFQKTNFITRLKARNKIRAAETMELTISQFLNITKIRYADEITKDTMPIFYSGLRDIHSNGERTVYNKSMDIAGWFRFMGLDVKLLLPDRIDYTKRDVSTYSPEQLKMLFEACGPYHRVVFQTLLMSGMREAEAMHLQWSDIDWDRGTLKIRPKKAGKADSAIKEEKSTSAAKKGHTIKDKEWRTIPVPDLIPILKDWKTKRPATHRLILGTSNDRPCNKWLPSLKKIVATAGLGCGGCDGCENSRGCSDWFLHKFRATFVTNLLRSGLDARTVMTFSGHSDIATVMRYWEPLHIAAAQETIKNIVWSSRS